MKDYLICFIDKGNCDIAQYTLISKDVFKAMESAMDIFKKENQDIEEVSEIRIIIVD